MLSPTVKALYEIKSAVLMGERRSVISGMISRAIRETLNAERTGETTPGNVLEVAK